MCIHITHGLQIHTYKFVCIYTAYTEFVGDICMEYLFHGTFVTDYKYTHTYGTGCVKWLTNAHITHERYTHHSRTLDMYIHISHEQYTHSHTTGRVTCLTHAHITHERYTHHSRTVYMYIHITHEQDTHTQLVCVCE